MNDETEWIFGAIADFNDAVREYGIHRVMSELPDDIYDALMYYFAKEENVSSSGRI